MITKGPTLVNCYAEERAYRVVANRLAAAGSTSVCVTGPRRREASTLCEPSRCADHAESSLLIACEELRWARHETPRGSLPAAVVCITTPHRRGCDPGEGEPELQAPEAITRRAACSNGLSNRLGGNWLQAPSGGLLPAGHGMTSRTGRSGTAPAGISVRGKLLTATPRDGPASARGYRATRARLLTAQSHFARSLPLACTSCSPLFG